MFNPRRADDLISCLEGVVSLKLLMNNLPYISFLTLLPFTAQQSFMSRGPEINNDDRHRSVETLSPFIST